MLYRYVYHENENCAFITLFSILKSAQIRNVNIDETRLTWFAWFDHNAAYTAATLALNIVFKQFWTISSHKLSSLSTFEDFFEKKGFYSRIPNN